MYRKIIIVVWLLLIFIVCFWTSLNAVFTDSVAEKKLRNQLCGSWQLVSYPKNIKYRFPLKEGEVIRFSKYFVYTENRLLPKQYKVKTISYEMRGNLFYNRQEIFLSAKSIRADYGYVISGISSDSLQLFPSFGIKFQMNGDVFLFKKVRTN
ncbi:hypothetical protein [Pedobacter sp.]|uniref:hypothetical protein n=1 Tax=Pedobacter sp. TaxID=1411316 RepID=UPI0031CF88E2